MTDQIHFRRQPNGGYAFDVNGTTYIAYRNEAGFAGRDWYLTKLEGEVGTPHEIETFVRDMLVSRNAAAEIARELEQQNAIPRSARVELSADRTAIVGEYHGKPTVAVIERGNTTPGQWFAETVASNEGDVIYIDFGQGWKLTPAETAILKGFAAGVVAASQI